MINLLKNKENRWIGTHMKPCIEWPEQIQYIKASSICLMTYDYWLGHTLEIYGVNMSSEKLKLFCIQWLTMKLKWVIFIIYQITRIKRKLFVLFNSLSCWDWYNPRKAKSLSVVSFSLLAVFHPILCYPQYKHTF